MIIASCATIPERKSFFMDSINRIKGQVDQVIVNCGYGDCPRNFENVVFRPHKRRIPSQSKFFVGSIVGDALWHLTFDDDILYPSNYVEKHLAVQQASKQALISCVHGAILPHCGVNNYFRDRKLIRFQRKSAQRRCDICGTGTICYSPKKIRFESSDFPEDNVDDLFVSIKSRSCGIPIIAIARCSQWLQPNRKNRQSPRIGAESHRKVGTLNELANRLMLSRDPK